MGIRRLQDEGAGQKRAITCKTSGFDTDRQQMSLHDRKTKKRRARDSNPQPVARHLISNEAANQFAYPPEHACSRGVVGIVRLPEIAEKMACANQSSNYYVTIVTVLQSCGNIACVHVHIIPHRRGNFRVPNELLQDDRGNHTSLSRAKRTPHIEGRGKTDFDGLLAISRLSNLSVSYNPSFLPILPTNLEIRSLQLFVSCQTAQFEHWPVAFMLRRFQQHLGNVGRQSAGSRRAFVAMLCCTTGRRLSHVPVIKRHSNHLAQSRDTVSRELFLQGIIKQMRPIVVAGFHGRPKR